MKVVILDEADYLNVNSAQPALRNLMETFSAHCRFILTCNYVEKIIDPIQSRCQSYKILRTISASRCTSLTYYYEVWYNQVS